MSKLVVQFVIKQWDKGQRSEEHVQARAQQPDRYPVTEPAARTLFDHQIIFDQHGDDVMGNRIRYDLTDNNEFIVDRFNFNLENNSLNIISQPDSMLPPKLLTTLGDGWVQCRYQWRYKVYEGGLYYWLYEEVIVNAALVEQLDEDVFMHTAPTQVFEAVQ